VELRARGAEPETLKIHRRMYEDRLRDMELSEKPPSKKDQTANESATNPAIVEHRDEPPKAAMRG
jgi:hypothetical protein